MCFKGPYRVEQKASASGNIYDLHLEHATLDNFFVSF